MITFELDGTTVFTADFPDARQVEVVGAFTRWDDQRYAMVQGGDGRWRLALSLGPGEHTFRYLVDGHTWALDADAHGLIAGGDGLMRSRLWRPPLRLDPDSLAA